MNYTNTKKLNLSELDITETDISEVIKILEDKRLGAPGEKAIEETVGARNSEHEHCQE